MNATALSTPVLPAIIEQTANQIYSTFNDRFKARLNGRQERALKLAVEGKVTHKTERIFSVRSENSSHVYLVDLAKGYCNCPDSDVGNVCKHRLAAYLIEQAMKAGQVNEPETSPKNETIEKVRLALHARSEFIREAIIYAHLPFDGEMLPVEIIELEGETAFIRALPRYKDGNLIPHFPFPERKSFSHVLARSLTAVTIYR